MKKGLDELIASCAEGKYEELYNPATEATIGVITDPGVIADIRRLSKALRARGEAADVVVVSHEHYEALKNAIPELKENADFLQSQMRLQGRRFMVEEDVQPLVEDEPETQGARAVQHLRGRRGKKGQRW